DQAGDVHELHLRRDDAGRAEHLGQLLQPWIRHADDAHIGLDRGERVIRRQSLCALGQRVEQRGLSDVGQADDADAQAHVGRVYGLPSACRTTATRRRAPDRPERAPDPVRHGRPARASAPAILARTAPPGAPPGRAAGWLKSYESVDVMALLLGLAIGLAAGLVIG